MFIEMWEREERLRRARAALTEIRNYPIRPFVKREQAPLPDRKWPRGVYEVEIAARGYRAFNIVYSNGDVSFHQFPVHRVTRSLVRDMIRRLDRDDPVPQLALVKPASPSFDQLPAPLLPPDLNPLP